MQYVQYNTMQYNAMQCNAMQYNTILFNVESMRSGCPYILPSQGLLFKMLGKERLVITTWNIKN